MSLRPESDRIKPTEPFYGSIYRRGNTIVWHPDPNAGDPHEQYAINERNGHFDGATVLPHFFTCEVLI